MNDRMKEEPFSKSGKHQAAIDRKNHTVLEMRFKEVYGKWPSALELQQARHFLKVSPTEESE